MPAAKEIRTKIKSVKNTQKITKAMEMVAASKMRKAQQRMQASVPYAEKIRTVIGHVAEANPDPRHPFLVGHPEIKKVGYIIVSTDRGLCGALNVNSFRTAMEAIEKDREAGREVSVCLIGTKGITFFRRLGMDIMSSTSQLGDAPKLSDLIGTVKVMLDAYAEGKLDQLKLVHAEFVNTMSQKPMVKQLLPIEAEDSEDLQDNWDYIFEPSAEALLDGLVMRYIEAQVYRGAVENVACEMAARMVAMKSASENAGTLINDLQLIYNKARQAAITQEISEIVSGAEAV
ncbi:MAG: F0F1 ATP synthase subunit gamma [Pseudomonadota bacterium]